MLAVNATDVRPPRSAAPGRRPITDRRGRECALLCAAVCLVGASAAAMAAPADCAEMKALIEKRMQARGASAPVLQIVPRSLARGRRVVATCEGGTQKIVQRTTAEPPAAVDAGESAASGATRRSMP